MGGQVAALLSGPPPYGDPPPDLPLRDTGSLPLPAGFGLDATVRSGGAVGLPPLSWDGTHLAREVPGGAVTARADRGLLQVEAIGDADPAAAGVLRRVLGLDDDLSGLHEGCAQVPALAWVPVAGAGRVLRGASAFEDLVHLLLGTGTSHARVRAVLRRLPDVAPEPLARLGEDGLRAAGAGFRAAPLARLAQRVADGAVEPEGWAALPDEEVVARVTALPGLGPFSAAGLLPLLGRPRPLVLDRWLGQQARALGVADEEDARRRYAPLGRWAGTGLWLEVSAAWLRPRPTSAAGPSR